MMSDSSTTLCIGMIGTGTIGSGVYEILMDSCGIGRRNIDGTNNDVARTARRCLPRNDNRRFIISKIFVRDTNKERQQFSFHNDGNNDDDYENNTRATQLVTSIDSILYDDSINIIVEIMDGDGSGGTKTTKKVVFEGLKQGKTVITANVAFLASHLDEIRKIVVHQQQQNSGSSNSKKSNFTRCAQLGLEAAVCGGIPIPHILQSCYAGDIIYQVMGIFDGTTNYMLGKMESSRDYDIVDDDSIFQEAQYVMGYTTDDGINEDDGKDDDEKKDDNPNTNIAMTNDLESSSSTATDDDNHHHQHHNTNNRHDYFVRGYNVRAKIALLTKLAFGVTIPDLSDIPCTGLDPITPVDWEYAKLLNCTIKLIGCATRTHQFSEYDGPLAVYVSPIMISKGEHQLLSKIHDCRNAIAITSANLGTNCYTGSGGTTTASSAAGLGSRTAATGSRCNPTAHSIVSDIMRLSSSSINGNKHSNNFPEADNIELQKLELNCNSYTSCFYIRIPYQDSLGIISIVGAIAENTGISIHSILQNPILNRHQADFCITTDECQYLQILNFMDLLKQEEFVIGEPLAMPMIQ